MKGLLADVNNGKQFRVLLMLLCDESRAAFWDYLGLTTPIPARPAFDCRLAATGRTAE